MLLPPDFGRWTWCESCECVSFVFNCGCSTCNASVCDKCEHSLHAWADKQIDEGKAPTKEELTG